MSDQLIVDLNDSGQASVGGVLNGTMLEPSGPVAPDWPLRTEDLADLRWYLEDYLRTPFGVYEDRGPEIAERLRQWGEGLFEAVFGGGAARACYRSVQAGSRSPAELVVRSRSPHLLSWPWELLWDPARSAPLALDMAGITRALPDGGLPDPFEVSGHELRVLMVIARPLGGRDIGYQMVARPLLERLEAIEGHVELVVLRPPSFEAFERELQEAAALARPFQIVHFDGHGELAGQQVGRQGASGQARMPSRRGLLLFENSAGGRQHVSAERFAHAVQQARVPLVVLNGCRSGAMGDEVGATVATRLLQAGVAAVVAMGYRVYAVAAADFMAAFYERLFAGDDVTAAVAAGRRRMFDGPQRPSPRGRMPLADWLVPVCYQRGEIRVTDLRHEATSAVHDRARSEPCDRRELGADAPDSDADASAGSGEFIGRDAEIYEVEQTCRHSAVVVVHGSAGAGKTELARAFGRWWCATGAVAASNRVIWYSFEPGRPNFGLAGALSAIGLRLFGTASATLADGERRQAVVEELRRHRTLVVWDNFETVRSVPDPMGATAPLTEREQSDLKDFLRDIAEPGGTSVLVVTSRSPETWLDDLPAIGRVELGGFSPDDRNSYADRLLAGSRVSPAQRSDRSFGELMTWLDGHPLSMRLVLPHLGAVGADGLLDGLRGREPLPRGADGPGRTSSLAASIAYSFDRLSEHTQTLLVVASVLRGAVDADMLGSVSRLDDLPARFQGRDRSEWLDVLHEAASSGLLSVGGAGSFTIHPALPSFLAARWRDQCPADHDHERLQVRNALLVAHVAQSRDLARAFDGDEAPAALALIDRQRYTMGDLLAHAVVQRQWDEALDLVRVLNDYWDTRGLTEEARGWVDRVRTAVESPDGDPPRVDTTAGALWLYMIRTQATRDMLAGDLTTAERDYERVLRLVEDGPDLPTTPQIISGTCLQLGNIARERGDLDQAEELLHRSRLISEELDDRRQLSQVYHLIGLVAEEREVFDEAEQWYLKSLAIDEELGSLPGQSATSHQLGSIAGLRERFDEAEAWFMRALNIDEKLGNQSSKARTHLMLGIIGQQRVMAEPTADHHLDGSEDWYRRALATFEASGDRSGQAHACHNLGTVEHQRGRMDGAEAWYRRALRIRDDLDDRPGRALTCVVLGTLADDRGQPREALEWVVRGVTIFDQFPHPLTGTGPDDLVRLTASLGTTALERCWREITGASLPRVVRDHIHEAGSPTPAPSSPQGAKE